jgi:hypothetical protein
MILNKNRCGRARRTSAAARALQFGLPTANPIAKENIMNRIYAALAALSLLATPAFAKSHHVAKAPTAVSDKAETKPAEAKPAEAKPAEGEAKPAEAKPKKTKKTTKKTEEKKEAAPEAAPAK